MCQFRKVDAIISTGFTRIFKRLLLEAYRG